MNPSEIQTTAPEQEIKKNAASELPNEVTIEDELGRSIVVAKPPYLKKLRLLATLGDELSSNRAYLQEISVVTWVKSIAGQPVPEVGTMREVEALAQRLEEEGFRAAIKGIMQLQGIDLDAKPADENNDKKVDTFTKK